MLRAVLLDLPDWNYNGLQPDTVTVAHNLKNTTLAVQHCPKYSIELAITPFIAVRRIWAQWVRQVKIRLSLGLM